MTLTPGSLTWLWDDEDKLRERARVAVAAWREAKEKSVPARWPADASDKQRPSKDPYKIAFDLLSRSRHPEDLVEFKRRLALFQQLVREEAGWRQVL